MSTDHEQTTGQHRRASHPFATRWNHNSQYYPQIADELQGYQMVLDVGCGDGTLARYLATGQVSGPPQLQDDTSQNDQPQDAQSQDSPLQDTPPEDTPDHASETRHSVVGIDSDSHVLPADSPGTHYLLADAHQIPFPAMSFDAVTSAAVLHLLNAELAITEMRRVLAPGGHIVIMDMARSSSPLDPHEARDVMAKLRLGMGTTKWEPPSHDFPAQWSFTEARDLVMDILPGARWQRLPLWRWIAVWDDPGIASAG